MCNLGSRSISFKIFLTVKLYSMTQTTLAFQVQFPFINGSDQAYKSMRFAILILLLQMSVKMTKSNLTGRHLSEHLDKNFHFIFWTPGRRLL